MRDSFFTIMGFSRCAAPSIYSRRKMRRGAFYAVGRATVPCPCGGGRQSRTGLYAPLVNKRSGTHPGKGVDRRGYRGILLTSFPASTPPDVPAGCRTLSSSAFAVLDEKRGSFTLAGDR